MSLSMPNSERIIEILTTLLSLPKSTAERALPSIRKILFILDETFRNRGKQNKENSRGQENRQDHSGAKAGQGNNRANGGQDHSGARVGQGNNRANNLGVDGKSAGYLDISVNGKSLVYITQGGIKNNLNCYQRQILASFLRLPNGSDVPYNEDMRSVKISYCYPNEENKVVNEVLFLASPGNKVINRLNDIIIDDPLILESLEKLQKGVKPTLKKNQSIADIVNVSFCSGLSNSNRDSNSLQNLHKIRQWTLGNLFNPIDWCKGLSSLSSRLNTGLKLFPYKSINSNSLGAGVCRHFVDNVETLFQALPKTSSLHLSTPPAAFYKDKPNAVWYCNTVNVSDHSINYYYSPDLPGKVEISIKMAFPLGNEQIMTVLWDKNRGCGYARISDCRNNSIGLGLINGLCDSNLALSLQRYVRDVPQEERINVNSWYENSRLMRKNLGHLVSAVHQCPTLAKFLPSSYYYPVFSVYQSALYNIADATLALEPNGGWGTKENCRSRFLRLPNPKDPYSQYEINLSHDGEIVIFSVPLSKNGQVLDSEKVSVYFNKAYPSVDMQGTIPLNRLDLEEMIAITDAAYSRFAARVNTLDPSTLKKSSAIIEDGNCLPKIKEGSLDFMRASQFPGEFIPAPSPFHKEVMDLSEQINESFDSLRRSKVSHVQAYHDHQASQNFDNWNYPTVASRESQVFNDGVNDHARAQVPLQEYSSPASVQPDAGLSASVQPEVGSEVQPNGQEYVFGATQNFLNKILQGNFSEAFTDNAVSLAKMGANKSSDLDVGLDLVPDDD